MKRAPVPAVERSNLNSAQIVALAGANRRRPKPVPPMVSKGPPVEAAPGITPTDRARKAVELALRHVDHAEVAEILAEHAPESEPEPEEPSRDDELAEARKRIAELEAASVSTPVSPVVAESTPSAPVADPK